MLKMFHKKKRWAIVTGSRYANKELALSRNTADGKTISVLINNRWTVVDTNELLMAVRYVTMPVDEFRRVKDGLLG